MQQRMGGGAVPFALAGAVVGGLLAGPRTGGSRRLAGGLAGAVVGVAWWIVYSRGRGVDREGRPGPVTQAIAAVEPADMTLGSAGANLDRRLDEAILETFPASDPIAITIE